MSRLIEDSIASILDSDGEAGDDAPPLLGGSVAFSAKGFLTPSSLLAHMQTDRRGRSTDDEAEAACCVETRLRSNIVSCAFDRVTPHCKSLPYLCVPSPTRDLFCPSAPVAVYDLPLPDVPPSPAGDLSAVT